jgi:hypothetical protein
MKSVPLSLLFLVAACASPTYAPGPQRISIERAGELVRAEILRENPEINPAVQIPLLEITPIEAWRAMSVQLFQVRNDSPVQGFETFAVRKGEIARLGKGLGGDGVGSTLVTDFDGDRSPDLAFTYSWGSGRRRSQVGVLRIAGDHMHVLPCEWSAEGSTYLVPGQSGTAQVQSASSGMGTLRVVEGTLRVIEN